MAFTVTLYKFSKIMNSTSAPDNNTTKQEFSCVLKDSCGVMSPVIELDLGLLTNPSEYNYAYIPEFSRYYYITEWEFTNRLWVCHLEEDLLATWKGWIGTEQMYILRSAYQYDNTIEDDMYPTLPQPTIINAAGSFKWPSNLVEGYYVVGVINNSSNAIGAVGYYVFTNVQFKNLCAKLMSNTSWLDVPTEISEGGIDDGLLRTLFNPFQYVVSCKWFPFEPPMGDEITSMPYGWWTLSDVTCHRLSSTIINVKEIDFTLTKHPQAASRGTYLNSSPFTQFTLSYYPFGDIVIDASPFAPETQLQTLTTVDCTTGTAILEICIKSNEENYPANVIERRTGNFGVDIQIAQISVDKLTQAETVISGTSAVARDTLHTAAQATNVSNLLNPLGGALGTAASAAQTVNTATHAIADGIRSSVPQMETSGLNGSISAFGLTPLLKQTFYSLVTEDLYNNGRPCCKLTTPATLGGYMVVKNAHVYFPGTVNELAGVNAYLESGFYYV